MEGEICCQCLDTLDGCTLHGDEWSHGGWWSDIDVYEYSWSFDAC